MATHADAAKRARQSIRRNERNRHYRSLLRSQVKKLREVVEKQDAKAAQAELAAAVGVIQRVARKGIIHRRNADRHVARLAALVGKLEKAAPKAPPKKRARKTTPSE